MLAKIADVMESVRAKTPLVHCITNYVTINDCANILLCFGASPAMCEAGAEVEEFVSFASALYINIGTFASDFAGCGAVWLARLPWEQEAGGSSPSIPTRPHGQVV
jgi:hydroxyethylthiazole kinase-like sugar kinase family protein